MKQSEGLILAFIALFGLLFSSCAPVTEATGAVALNVSNTIGGVSKASYDIPCA